MFKCAFFPFFCFFVFFELPARNRFIKSQFSENLLHCFKAHVTYVWRRFEKQTKLNDPERQKSDSPAADLLQVPKREHLMALNSQALSAYGLSRTLISVETAPPTPTPNPEPLRIANNKTCIRKKFQFYHETCSVNWQTRRSFLSQIRTWTYFYFDF